MSAGGLRGHLLVPLRDVHDRGLKPHYVPLGGLLFHHAPQFGEHGPPREYPVHAYANTGGADGVVGGGHLFRERLDRFPRRPRSTGWRGSSPSWRTSRRCRAKSRESPDPATPVSCVACPSFYGKFSIKKGCHTLWR